VITPAPPSVDGLSERTHRMGSRRKRKSRLSDSDEDSSDEFTPSTEGKRARQSKQVRQSSNNSSSLSQERQRRHSSRIESLSQHQLAQEESQSNGRKVENSATGTVTREPATVIEIHEVEDDDAEEEPSFVSCRQCTYHNPIGASKCEICAAKLQTISASSAVLCSVPALSLSEYLFCRMRVGGSEEQKQPHHLPPHRRALL
jgi:transglutaminase/protease-like cytokinesis protein 3